MNTGKSDFDQDDSKINVEHMMMAAAVLFKAAGGEKKPQDLRIRIMPSSVQVKLEGQIDQEKKMKNRILRTLRNYFRGAE